jgi:hypothetical protein
VPKVGALILANDPLAKNSLLRHSCADFPLSPRRNPIEAPSPWIAKDRRIEPPGRQQWIEFSAKQFFAGFRQASIGLLRRAAGTDPEAASLLLAHPRNVDGVILHVHLRG